uniref:Chemosensory protein 4 n=1 Tax=Aulacocentrum confusum TaxID=2767324 RepID=A0A7G8Z916_9HYME|nr:chemosensory protein 4 [Aulacocentrum confusum]
MIFQSFILVIVGLSAIVAQELYSDKYDHINVDEILANSRLRESYLQCYLRSGPCVTADAKFFRDTFAEAVLTQCVKCTARQTEIFNKITDWYTKNEPEKYNMVIAKAVKFLAMNNH